MDQQQAQAMISQLTTEFWLRFNLRIEIKSWTMEQSSPIDHYRGKSLSILIYTFKLWIGNIKGY